MRLRARAVREAGSVLALVPAGFLVLVTLGALAVDSAVQYQGQQRLHDTLVAAAGDAASAAVDRPAFYSSGAVELSPAVAARVVCQSVGAQRSSELRVTGIWLEVRGPIIRVAAEATVHAVFGKAIPGFGTRHVKALVTASAVTQASNRSGAPETLADLKPLACS